MGLLKTSDLLSNQTPSGIVASGVSNDITWVNQTGYDVFGMINNNKLYTTTALASTYATGRGQKPVPGKSMESLKEVFFPNNEIYNGSKIVDVGLYFGVSFALFDNGNLYTWGNNLYGECGLGHNSPVALPTLAATNVTKVYSSKSFSFGYSSTTQIAYGKLFIKKSDGYIYGTGYNGQGNLGLGDTTNRNTFTQITSLGTNVVGLWPMGTYPTDTIAQTADGKIWACGYNGQGELGLNTITVTNTFTDVTTAWTGLAADPNNLIKEISSSVGYNSGGSQGCSIHMLLNLNGTTLVRSCGYNGYGQLGDNTTSDKHLPITPNDTSSLNVKDLCVMQGNASVYILTTDGNLWAWGYNGYGQLGTGDAVNKNVPTLVISDGSVKEILNKNSAIHDTGYTVNTFIRKADDTVWVAGYNLNGQLGTGETGTTPKTVFTKTFVPSNPKLFGMFSYSSQYRIYYCVTQDNKLYAWGNNTNYEITNNANAGSMAIMPTNVPVLVS